MTRIGIVVFVMACLVMHLVQPELSVMNDAVSYYMNGRAGWVLGVGLVALGAGSLWLAISLKGGARWWLGLWGLGAIVGGLFAPDPIGSWNRPPSFSGMMHSGAAMAAFLAFPAGAWISGRQRRLAIASALLLLVFFACLAPVFSNRAPVALGLVERALLSVYLVWLWRAVS